MRLVLETLWNEEALMPLLLGCRFSEEGAMVIGKFCLALLKSSI